MSEEVPRGQAAERLAVRMLTERGYRILETNFRSRLGEIDIIAEFGSVLIFVEVKERTGERFGSAEEAVDSRKLERMLATAEVFVAEHPDYRDHLWRVDLIAITLKRDGSILRRRHIENLIVD